ncbi:aman-3 [Blepharisma stoltei]|uniref:Alpha-mannosidase n=1 Tax=Blepharisma stoltei TaxID=1481888 RepID=A0AAU9JG61_9CILI|nr:unnamed protein product [Blepharisma stoltei]
MKNNYIIAMDSPIEVFIVPHTHCDPGWLETMEWYYENRVRNIFQTIITLLSENDKLKMVWCETSFLKMWMDEQSHEIQTKTKKLIEKGQLEIVGGGYIQTDEACPDIDMIIRQIEHGHEYLYETFSIPKVKVGWQIDPFGHSALLPSIFAKFGYEYHVINRIDTAFKRQLISEGNLEFVWYGSNLGQNESIFTHVLYEHYSPPRILHPWDPFYCFGNGDLTQEILESSAEKLYDLAVKRRSAYKTSKIMFLYGDDFWFSNLKQSRIGFEKIEALVDYVNSSERFQNFKIKIATASEYFEAVRKENVRFSVYRGDFFPYRVFRGEPRSIYWTGYYTTRPLLKKLIWEAHSLARAAEISKTFSAEKCFLAYEASLALHHDAITGTCRPHVAHDYKKRLKNDIYQAARTIASVITSKFSLTKEISFTLTLPYRVIIVYNPLNWAKTSLLSLSTPKKTYLEIRDGKGNFINSQIVKDFSNDEYTVYFKAELPSLSFSAFFITQHDEPIENCSIDSDVNQGYILSDSYHSIEFSKTGMVKNISKENKKLEISQQFWMYPGPRSGAYIFKPISEGKKLKNLSLQAINISTGPIVQVAEVLWKRKSKQPSERLYYQKVILYGENKFSWDFGVFAYKDEEILVRLTSKEIVDQTWLFTSNSGDLRSRAYSQCDYSDKGNNMYPIPGGFAVKMQNHYMKMFPSYPVGLGMASENSFELLLHRNLTHDDWLGMCTGVIDKTYAHHHFDIEFGESLNSQFLKSYVETKTVPYLFSVINKELDVTLDNWREAKQFRTQWNHETNHELGYENSQVYLSSALAKNNSFIFRVFNFSNEKQLISMKNFTILDRIRFGGYEHVQESEKFQESSEEIVYSNKPNSSFPIQLYASQPIPDTQFHLLPSEFSTFISAKIIK